MLIYKCTYLCLVIGLLNDLVEDYNLDDKSSITLIVYGILDLLDYDWF